MCLIVLFCRVGIVPDVISLFVIVLCGLSFLDLYDFVCGIYL